MSAKNIKVGQVRDALVGSITSWENKSEEAYAEIDMGPGGCPLCTLFHKGWKPGGAVKKGCCEGCPIAIHTGKKLCADTPYDTVNKLHEDVVCNPDQDDSALEEDCKALDASILEELEFLKELNQDFEEAFAGVPDTDPYIY